MSNFDIGSIVKHYEKCLKLYGDTHLGVDWPNLADVNKRYQVMLDVIRFSGKPDSNFSILDFGCGAGHLLQFLLDKHYTYSYSGLDISGIFIELCKVKFPHHQFYCGDIYQNDFVLPNFDFIVMNGVFTEKRELSYDEMWKYFCSMLKEVFQHANLGIAFNVMSKAVEWERDDLFHVPADALVDFITKNLTRNFIIRNDYGLYEYTTYVYK